MIHVVLARAFVNAEGAHGNPALVVIEPAHRKATAEQRQALADELGIPAVAYVTDTERGTVRIHGSYGRPIRFGGHPLLATTEVMHRLGSPVTQLTPSAGTVACRRDDSGTVWLTAPAEWSKPWRHHRMVSAEEIDELTGLPEGEDFTQVWAWLDEDAGRVRARLWAPRIGKGEDEACGSASMLLTLKLDRDLEVLHGRHRAVIRTRRAGAGRVELGGRCVLDAPSAAVTEKVEALYCRA